MATSTPSLAVDDMPILTLVHTLGAIFLGACVGLVLYGMTAYQTHRYFRQYNSDPPVLKLTVLALFLADTLHGAVCVHICYYYLVGSREHHSVLAYGVWSLRILALVTQIVGTVVQGFYLRRIHIIGQTSIIIQALVVVFMLGSIAATLVITGVGFEVQLLSRWSEHSWLSGVPFALTLAADWLLAGTLVLFLHQSRTGMRHTNSLLNTLIIYTVNTGLLTSTFSILSLIFAIIQPSNFIYVALNMPTTNCYTNSMLAVLNSRRALVDRACAIADDLGALGMTASPSVGLRLGRLSLSYECHSIAFRSASDIARERPDVGKDVAESQCG